MLNTTEWEELDERTIRQKTIDFLKENKDFAFTAKEISEKLNVKLKTLSSQVSNLIKEMKVQRKKVMITGNKAGEKMFDVYYKISDDVNCVNPAEEKT